jgi:hypothetical protein
MVSERVYIHGVKQRRIADRVAAQEAFLLSEQARNKEIKSEEVSPDMNQMHKHTSYSGCDIKAIVSFYDLNAEEKNRSRQKVLGDVQTITYSTHREKFPVRTLGRTKTKGYTRGPRTIGGTLIFTVFDKTVLSEMLVQNYQDDASDRDNYGVWKAVLIDQIPPFDITISFVNEYGSVSKLVLYGVELVNEGQTMSIDDLITENVVSFVARHIDPMFSMRDPNQFGDWTDAVHQELNFEQMVQDVRVRRLLATMDKPAPNQKKVYAPIK